MALRAHHLTIVLAATMALGAPAAAGAQTSIDQVAASLRSDPVYVDPQARSVLSQQAERRVEDEIRTKDPGPMYVAVLPASASNGAGGSASGVVVQLYRALGQRQGTYVASVGHNLSAASQGVLRPGVASQLRADAISAHKGDGLGPILVDFVDRAAEARANGGRAPSSGGGGGGGGLLGVLAVIAAGGGLFAFFRRRRRRREEQAQVEELRTAARDDLVALGDDVRAIDIPIEQRDADPRAREALGVALQRYEEAETALDRARRPEDFEPIAQALEDGRFQMEVAKARLERRPPPERRPPCFFDPRHGPSVRDVEWAPPGGQPRPVPACAADAVRVESGEEPAMREVVAGGSRMPYWQAPGFGPWAGGFYGGYGGGLLPGLLVGTLLGGSLFGPSVAYGGGFGDGGFGDGGYGDGGDFGGGDQGDFGNADFGSQDWGGGGGDFGGGDFGGGGGDF